MKKKKIIPLMLVMALTLGACESNITVSETGETAANTENVEATETSDTETAEAVSTESELSESEVATYAEKLFTTDEVHTINVEISEEDWSDLLENPTSKTKYEANITIDGETLESVSFSTKGNTSLSSVASDEDSDRYSFKVNFGKYNEDQTYYGLDKLNLNNIYADATFMKDYLSYRIFEEAGLDSPLTSYVWLTVNGEDAGLYLAIEEIGDSYLSRTTDGEGELYKPESEQLNNVGNMDHDHKQGKPGEMPEGMEMPEDFDFPEGMEMPENHKRPGEDGHKHEGGMGESNSGASLKYTDDELDSYSDIFDNAETDADDEDKARVVEALKNLSEGNVEEALNIDEVISYFVAHNFVMNYDSYTGNMLHNYYLYENDGKLSMLPWDYNLAFGAFMGMEHNKAGGSDDSSDATSIINYGIDSPLSGALEEDRPMWSWISANEEYLEKYHAAYDSLIANYFESGECAAEIAQIAEMIRPYIEKDPTAFYDVDEFDKAIETLQAFCEKRAESIRLQIDGTLSTITDEQNDEDRVDASDITINDMGSQNSGKGGPGEGKQGKGGPGEGGPDGEAPEGFEPGQDGQKEAQDEKE